MSNLLTQTWSLDSRLEADTLLIGLEESEWQTRLMNDNRWPWIIVIPAHAGVEDIEDYPLEKQTALMAHLAEISTALKAMDICTSTNVASLGNVVKQMHWHVVGRREGDPNWPAPVWGFETAIAYGKQEAVSFISRFREAYGADRLF